MILFYYCSLLFTAAAAVEEYTFALIPKSKSNPFFKLVYDGFESRANDRSSSSSSSSSPMNITCRFIGPYNESATEQVTIIDDLIAGIKYGPVNGISVSVVDSNILTPAINRAIEAGIPVITFDSDAVNSTRKSYVGTDNFAFGEELGKLLKQVKPEGGMYGVIAASAPNVVERYNGINYKLAEDSNWKPILDTYLDCEDNTAIALEQMNDFVNMGVQAIIPVGFWPMEDKESWIDFVDDNTNITLIVGDSLEVQMELMNMGYVDGLVGQLPFEMGKDSIDVLLKLANDEDVGMINYGTSILEVLRFPLVLPPINDGNGVNNNYIGTLSILGYLIYALIVASSLFLMVWTHLYKETRVVKASQPFFLQMIIGGIVIFSSAIIPLSIDDQKSSQKSCDMACMATPWLLTIGFTTTVRGDNIILAYCLPHCVC
jgi:ABC-type sugar transport system substrate-binding protein